MFRSPVRAGESGGNDRSRHRRWRVTIMIGSVYGFVPFDLNCERVLAP